MAISKAVVSRVRVLAITHILAGALLIIFGIANGVTPNSYPDIFNSSFGFFGIGTGVWMCIAGALGIPGCTLQRTRRSNLFASVFMGFFILSAVFGGLIIIDFGTRTPGSCQCSCFGYDCGNATCELGSDPCSNDSCNTVMRLAGMILALGIIEFATGICVAICLCMMRPCCTDLEESDAHFSAVEYSAAYFVSSFGSTKERQPLVNSVRG
ncbi:PREDICTED: uncharacterized protein LOC107336924 isoform X3 [Acropora digitifera]|uniref:uncharacterized protein LOC107336924 isoform X3 n=1 Tax=Acropora digitifera TaxID=70779 RepID=UPI00077A7672|nr:PREDICTED: uncharacterized protein LOC107336924 isoform X3 [Acropora digitifera]